jgi:hypothetical protein
LALGLDGVRGIVADSKAYCKRTLNRSTGDWHSEVLL